MADRVDIKKIAPTLSGKERARFIIKDEYMRRCDKKAGFLTLAEREALFQMNGDYEKWQEFKKYRKMYIVAPEVWVTLVYAYKEFIALYNSILDMRYMILCSRDLRIVSDIVNDCVTDRKKADDALKLLKRQQAIEIIERAPDKPYKIAIKDVLAKALKDAILEIYGKACDVLGLIMVAEKISQEIGLDIYEWLGATPKHLMTGMNLIIEEHNATFQEAVGDDCLEHIDNYLISQPIVTAELYNRLEKEMLS